MIENINNYLSLILNIITLLGIIASVIFFLSGSAKRKFENLVLQIREQSSNLPDGVIDDFKFTDLKLRISQNINYGCIAMTREIHSSGKDNDNSEKIEAYSKDGKLILKYKHIKHNTDSWLNYTLKGLGNLQEYCNRGYYLSFCCRSQDATNLLLEIKGGEFKAISVPLNNDNTTYFYRLIVNDPKQLKEISFTIKPEVDNKLVGIIELSDLKIVKDIKCNICNNKHTNLKNVNECKCGNLLKALY